MRASLQRVRAELNRTGGSAVFAMLVALVLVLVVGPAGLAPKALEAGATAQSGATSSESGERADNNDHKVLIQLSFAGEEQEEEDPDDGDEVSLRGSQSAAYKSARSNKLAVTFANWPSGLARAYSARGPPLA